MATNPSSWQATILTIFPDMFPGLLSQSLVGKALTEKIWDLNVVNIRNYAKDKHASVDDTPYGGGAGMVMRADVLSDAIQNNHNPDHELIYLSPRGEVLNQNIIKGLVTKPGVTLLCGRYEGVDERVLEHHNIREISMGDFVLSGGEPAAIAMIDACVRLLPGVLGKAESHMQDSFEEGLLEYPHYTRPQIWQGLAVPDVLVGGHHEKINEWRKEKAEMITQKRRPDLWQKYIAEDVYF